jgi:peptide/nickel transport system permease protein
MQGSSSRRFQEVRYAFYLFRKNPIVLAGAFISVISLILSIVSPYIVNPNLWKFTDLTKRLCWNNHLVNWGIRNVFDCGGNVYPLGTDIYGRDLLKMMVLAVPLDMQISLEIVASAVLIGIVFGSVAAYAGGIVDEIVLRITDIFLAVPGILLAIVMMVVLGRTIPILTLAVLVTWWPTYVRLMRSQVLSEKEKPYIDSLKAIGAGRFRILFRHIIPNSVYPIVVQATLDIGSVILTVSALTFIGLTPSPLLPELGTLASSGAQYVFTAPWLTIFPGLAILVISLGFNLLGDGIRDVFDPRLRR